MNEADWLSSEDPAAMLEWLTNPAPVLPGDGPIPPRASDRKLRLFAGACHPGDRYWCEWSKREVTIPSELQPRDGALFSVGIKINQNPPENLDAKEKAYRAALLRDIVGNPWKPVAFGDAQIGSGYICEKCGNIWQRKGVHSSWYACQQCGESNRIRKHRQRDLWLTPQVLSLATAAYAERPSRKCERCNGGKGWWRCSNCHGEWLGDVGPDCFVCSHPRLDRIDCPDCHGTGTINDGKLDPANLAVLSDALEEAGCTDEVILRHLRGFRPVEVRKMGRHVRWEWMPSPHPHVRGCHVVDAILSKE